MISAGEIFGNNLYIVPAPNLDSSFYRLIDLGDDFHHQEGTYFYQTIGRVAGYVQLHEDGRAVVYDDPRSLNVIGEMIYSEGTVDDLNRDGFFAAQDGTITPVDGGADAYELVQRTLLEDTLFTQSRGGICSSFASCLRRFSTNLWTGETTVNPETLHAIATFSAENFPTGEEHYIITDEGLTSLYDYEDVHAWDVYPEYDPNLERIFNHVVRKHISANVAQNRHAERLSCGQIVYHNNPNNRLIIVSMILLETPLSDERYISALVRPENGGEVSNINIDLLHPVD